MRYLVLAATLAGTALFAQDWANPVIAGDHPDPSLVRVGNDYYATATSSGWAPIFPVYHSRDLKTWRQVGAMFERPPEWSAGNYWAPEITHYRGQFYVYYTARKRNGPLCVAVATAGKASGPWSDHGPLVCDPDGSIDGFAITGEDGRRYLIYKEDGNSRKMPTPIWAQRLTEDGLKVTGDRTELIRNTAPWEGAVVEGPFILPHNGYFYLFYAGGACCGTGCDYAEGAARSKQLLGPYEKAPSNPIVPASSTWKCPGHGSLVVDPAGRTFFLYHAYNVKDSIYVGRESLLDEVTWTDAGWPAVNGGRGPSSAQKPAGPGFEDAFNAPALTPGWQWPPGNEPKIRTGGGTLRLEPSEPANGNFTAAIIARSPTHADLSALTSVDASHLAPGVSAGIAGYGDARNALGLAATQGALVLWRRENGATTVVSETPLDTRGPVRLRMTIVAGRRFHFAWSRDGKSWKALGTELEGGYLPPWDLATRIALTASGPAEFDFFRIEAPATRAAAAASTAAHR